MNLESWWRLGEGLLEREGYDSGEGRDAIAGLITQLRGHCAKRGDWCGMHLTWHDNGYASRLSLNKAGVLPGFAAFWAKLLRL